jgi:hypothetical protein
MNLRLFALPLVLLAAVPASAQTTPPVISKAHDAAAARVVDKLWPLGTYRRMMDGAMSKMMDSMLESMFGMKAADIIPPEGKEATQMSTGNKTLLELAEEKDPHFRERMTITMDVMMREMVPLMEKIEPSIRDSLGSIYARDYSEAQLGELNTFLSTPTGQVFGQRWMMSMVDPEMVSNMAKIAPTMMQEMPAIMKKIEAATAHLPPLPAAKND